MKNIKKMIKVVEICFILCFVSLVLAIFGENSLAVAMLVVVAIIAGVSTLSYSGDE